MQKELLCFYKKYVVIKIIRKQNLCVHFKLKEMETLPTGEHSIRLQYHCHRNWHSDSKIDKAYRGTDDSRGYQSYASTRAHTRIYVSSSAFPSSSKLIL